MAGTRGGGGGSHGLPAQVISGDPGTGSLPFALTTWGPVPSASPPGAVGSCGFLPQSLHVLVTRGRWTRVFRVHERRLPVVFSRPVCKCSLCFFGIKITSLFAEFYVWHGSGPAHALVRCHVPWSRVASAPSPSPCLSCPRGPQGDPACARFFLMRLRVRDPSAQRAVAVGQWRNVGWGCCGALQCPLWEGTAGSWESRSDVGPPPSPCSRSSRSRKPTAHRGGSWRF